MSNLTAKDLCGCMTAVVTPMHEGGEIDFAQWQSFIGKQVNAKIKAVVVAGTTGESALLSPKEFEQLVTQAVNVCKGSSTHVIVGTGSIAVDKVIETNELAFKLGAQAVLVVTPYYLRTTQDGLFQHFKKIADASSLPIILYNVPSRTQNDLSEQTTYKLACHNNIIGIKEASTQENRVNNLAKLCQDLDFNVLTGNDDGFLQALVDGANGVISVASNIRPVTFIQICSMFDLGDTISAKTLNTSLDNLYKVLSCQPNPIPVKYLLHKAGLIGNGIRLPLVWFDDDSDLDTKTEIFKTIEEYCKI